MSFYLGTEVEQSHLHDASGIILMIAALLNVFRLDAVLADASSRPRMSTSSGIRR